MRKEATTEPGGAVSGHTCVAHDLSAGTGTVIVLIPKWVFFLNLFLYSVMWTFLFETKRK